MDDKPLRKQLPSLRTSAAPMTGISPSRSRTDPPVPEHHEKSPLHRRLHSNSLRHRAFTGSRSHHHHSAKDAVQSALELKPPISFDQLLRRDKKTPDHTRQGSTNPPTDQKYDQAREWAAQQAARAEQRKTKPQDVKKARADNVKREQELQRSLKQVEETAMSSTRQLDETYYSILEKASLLRSTVASLQQLAEESRKMHASFQDESTVLEKDTKESLASFKNFDEQEKNINELVDHLKKSKRRTDKLNESLEACRNRIEAFEKRENEKAKKRRQQWGAVWGMLVSVLLLIIIVVIVKKRSTVGSNLHHVAKILDEFENEIASPITARLKAKTSPSEDPYLRRLFDEL